MTSRQASERLDLAAKASTVLLGVMAATAFMYYASSVVITIFASVLVAIALEPLVVFLAKRARLGRQFASILVVTLSMVLIYFGVQFLYVRAASFVSEVPALSEKIQNAPIVQGAMERFNRVSSAFEEAARSFNLSDQRDGASSPGAKGRVTTVFVREGPGYGEKVLKSLGSMSHVAFSLGFIPFLVYFILSWKEQLMDRIGLLFGVRNSEGVLATVAKIEKMMQKFLVGNLIVTGIVCALTAGLFMAVGLPYGILLGMVSGIVSMIPYLGALLSLIPGVLVGLVAFKSAAPFLVLIVGVTAIHFTAIHYLMPKTIGGGINLNAVSATIAILFFGWLWGGLGLLLGIPIVGVIKNILDEIESTRTIGYLLGDEKSLDWQTQQENGKEKEEGPAARAEVAG